MPTEIEIRDYLAEHLDLIEGGLALLRGVALILRS